jgi:hypothetical protein
MREFDRAGIVDSDGYRSALIYVGVLAALALFLGTDRALTYSPSKDAGCFRRGGTTIAILCPVR